MCLVDIGMDSALQPPEGLYRMTACFYLAWTCGMDTCDAPDDTGLISNAVPDGEMQCVTEALSIPTAAETVELSVEVAVR